MGTRHAITNIDHTLPPLAVELLTTAIDHHLVYKEQSGQAARLYQARLAWFLRWLRVEPVNGGQLHPADFVEFRQWLATIRSKRQNKPLGVDWQQEILKRLRSALRWSFREGRLAHDYSSWVPGANYDRIVDPVYTFDDDELLEVDGAAPVGDDHLQDPNLHLVGISTSLVRSWLEIFINAKRLAGLAEITLRDYHIRIGRYLAFVDDRHLAGAMSPGAVELYLAQRRATVSPHSVYGDYRTLSVFCNWLVKRAYLDLSPLLELEKPKLPRKRMRHVSYDQFRQLHRSITGDDWMARRDRLILTILFFSGLRAGEVIGLHQNDIERGEGVLYVRQGKGDKDRITPYHPDVPWLVDAYLDVRPPFEGSALIVSSDGAGGIRGAMHYSGLKQMLRRRCKAAGLPLYNLHAFRHGFAITFLNHGMEMTAVGRAMGHSSSAVTEGYARWSSTGLRTAYLAALARFSVPGSP